MQTDVLDKTWQACMQACSYAWCCVGSLVFLMLC